MRKDQFTLFTLLLLAFSTGLVFAQRPYNVQPGEFASMPSNERTTGGGDCDTVDYGFPIPGQLVIYSSSGWGFASGHNDYGDLAFAERVANTNGFTRVFGVRFQFGYGASSGPAAKVAVRIWPESSGAPGTPLYSQDITLDSIISASGNVTVEFPTAVAVSGPFYAGFEVTYNPGDTVAVFTTVDSAVFAPSTAWSKFSNGTWYPFDDGTNSWGLRIKQAIYPVVLEGNFPVTILPANPTIPSGGQVQLTASGGINHVWSPATGLSCTNCSNPTASPGTTTTYTVVAWDSTSSCSASQTTTVTVTGVGVDDPSAEGQLTVHPNPSQGNVNLEFVDWKEARAQVAVVNSMGQVVRQVEWNGLAGNARKELALNDLSSGCYLLRVTAGQKTLTRRLVLE